MKKSVILLVGVLFLFTNANGQINDPAETVKHKGTDKINQKSDDLIDSGLDAIEDRINSIFKKKDKKEKKKEKQSNSPSHSSNSNSGSDTDFSDYEGSDFVPGKNVLFFEDFSIAKLGSGNGNWYVYEYNESSEAERPSIKNISSTNGKWFKMPRKGFAFPNSFKNLPEQFTIEFDLYADPELMNEMEGGFRANFVAREDRDQYDIHWNQSPALGIDVHPHGQTEFVNISAVTEYKPDGYHEDMILMDETFKTGWNPGEVNRISIYRNGKQIIMYLNGKEMFNLSNGLPKKAQYNLIFSTNLWGDGMYVSNIRVAGNVPNATQDIKSEGKFVTNAIYFDVNSARIKPQSWATLNQVAQAIQSNSGNILIIGHTDSDGTDETNLTLSKNRAESVKSALIKEFGINASRLQTDGKGELQPVDSNNTASAKAQNRRVEFIKL